MQRVADKAFAWSWSQLNAFETCPRRHHLIKTKQVTEKQSDAMAWGNRVHIALDKRLKREQPLPEALAAYEPLVARIEAIGGVIESEQKMGLNSSFEPTGYFAHDTWCRVITDVTVVKGRKAFVGDWKTGKPSPASAQLALCALATFAFKPEVNDIVTSFVWLQDGKTTNAVYKRSDIPRLWNDFLPRVARMERATETENFPPIPSGLCKSWCPVPKRLCGHSGLS